MLDIRRLWCLVDGDPAPTQVIVDLHSSPNVDYLKDCIKSKNALHGVRTSHVVLWQLIDPEPVEPEDTLRKRIASRGDMTTFATKLTATQKVSTLFPQQSSEYCDLVHILVQLPSTTIIGPSCSNHSNTSSVPSTSDHWSPRHDTVRSLYEALLQENLVQVRGTPGCGKTTLMNLLHAYILQRSPSSFVYTWHSWPRLEAAPLEQRLRKVDPEFPRHSGLVFLLFDEAQDTYEDDHLWNSFFKEVGGVYHHYRVILFCSYGSPSPRPVAYRIGTQLVLRDAARISLWPGEKSTGILLKRSEFDEVVSRFERPLNLHPDLLDLVFDWTVGHAGAVVELLRVISYQRVSDTQRGVQFTVEAFHHENPTHELVWKLRGAVERGLPSDRELSAHPDVAAFLRTLLRDGAVDRDEDEDEVIHKCHRHGWIHSDPTTVFEVKVRYTLPSPLHTACLSWRLGPTNDMPHFTSLFHLAINALSKLKPSQLLLPTRRVSSMSTDRLPEVQYKEEFYRSLFSVTFGNVCISPEFASGKTRRAHVAGPVDFFIPVMKWGIELTRDGSGLAERNSRFTEFGEYIAWLKSGNMHYYILLDYCTSISREEFPDIPNLFHIVFQDDYRQFVVYDNMVKRVKGPIVLQENP